MLNMIEKAASLIGGPPMRADMQAADQTNVIAALQKNLTLLYSHLDAIKAQIEAKGVSVGTAGTQAYADLIAEIQAAGDGDEYYEILRAILVNDASSLRIPEVPSMRQYALAYANAREITLAEGLKTVGSYGFYYANINGIKIPASVEQLADNSFRNCLSMHTVEFQGTKTNTSANTFYGCKNTTGLTVPVGYLGNLHFPQSTKFTAATLEAIVMNYGHNDTGSEIVFSIGSENAEKLSSNAVQILAAKNITLVA